MNVTEDIRPVSYLKAHVAELLLQVNETHRPVFVTQNGEPKGVLMDTFSYEKMKNALEFMQLIAIGEKDVKEGKLVSQKDVFDKLKKQLSIRK